MSVRRLLDKSVILCYNYIVMMINTNEIEMDTKRMLTIPPALIQEADGLSKATKITFRDCLEILMKSYLSEKKVGWTARTLGR